MAKETRGKKGLSIYSMLLLFALLPVAVVGIILVVASYTSMSNNLVDQTKSTLQIASQGLKEYYEYDLGPDGSGDIAYEVAYVDSLASQGVDLTIFKDNVRFFTSIKDASGKRIEGTTASDAVWAEVSAGKDYYSDSVVINDTPYYVYYRPLKDADGKVWGAAFAGITQTKVRNSKTKLLTTMVIVCLIVFVVVIALAIFIARKVVKPIEMVAESITKISEGNIREPVTAEATLRETAKLISAATVLQSTMQDIMGKTKTATSTMAQSVTSITSISEESAESAKQISTAMSELADGASLLAENVQDMNSKIIEMGNLIGDISDNVTSLTDSSKNMAQANEDATGYINKMSESSDKSVKAVRDITSQVSETNEAIIGINNAVTLITDIAGQTNLLALNASIEAARAGEQGKGFAVVADEIKKLAEQSNDSAEEIRRTVEEILQKSEASVGLAKTVEDIIKEEQGLLAETKNKFDLLNSEIQSSVAGINDISAKTDDLDSIKTVITSSISDLSAVSEENSASNEEVSASIETIAENIANISGSMTELDSLSSNLEASVEYFN